MVAARRAEYGGGVEPMEIFLIREECRALSIAYARALDFRDYDDLANLFTEDGVVDTVRQAEGRAAIRASLNERPDEIRTRHVITNTFVEVIDAESARGISYVSLYRHQGPESLDPGPVELDAPAAIGHYEDAFRRTPDGWRLARRKLHLAFKNPTKF